MKIRDITNESTMSAGIATVVAPMGVMSRRKKSKTLLASTDVDEGTGTSSQAYKNLTRDELAQEIEQTIIQFGKDSKQAQQAQAEFARRIKTKKFGKGGLRTDKKKEVKKEQ